MSVSNPFLNLPALEQVIDRSLITLKPETPLVDAISLMSQAPGRHCALPETDESTHTNLQGQIHSSCVLVVNGSSRLVGILTERDVVKLATTEMGLSDLRVDDAMTRQVVTMTLSASVNTLSALALFRQHQIRHLPVLDDQGHLVGIITPRNIRQVLQPMNLLRLRRVAEVMTPDVIHASRTASVLEIARQMTEHRVSCVVIADSDPVEHQPPTPVGIITERDIVQFQALELNLGQISAQTAMSTPLCCLNPTDSLWVAHQEMKARYVQRLVVAGDQGELMGIVTQTSLLQVLDPLEMAAVIGMLQQEVEHRTEELTQVNQQLQGALDQLEYQVEQRTSELKQANARLREEIDAKDATLCNISQVEATLRESERRFSTLMNNLPGYVYRVTNDPNYTPEFISQGVFAITGYRQEEYLIDRTISCGQEIHPEDSEWVWNRVQQSVVVQQPYECEYRIITKSGMQKWVWERGRGIYGEQGELISLEGFVTNVSDRVQAEEQQAFQASLLDQVRNAVIATDLAGRVTYWNQFAQQLYQIAPEDMGRSILEITVPVKHQEIAQEVMASIQATGAWEGEFEVQRRDGSTFMAYVVDTLVRDQAGNACGIVGISIDISNRKQAELEIQKFVSLADNSTALIGMCDMNFVPTYINPAGKQMVGLDDTRQYIETPAQEFFFPEDRDFVINDFFPTVLREGKGEVEIRFRHFKTGEAVWMVYSVFCIKDTHNQPIGLATISRNISDRKQSEKKIREQAVLIDISPDAIMVRDLDCHILFWNKGAEQIYGWTATEILGRNSRELLSQRSLPQVEIALQTILKTGEWRGEFQKVAKSGKEIQIDSRWKLLRNETGQPHAILTVESDITEQKQLEAQFLRAQRLESLGTLASGIAHDMNNILAPMLASAQLLPILNPTLDEQSQQLLAIFEDNTKRGGELVKQILAFARGMEGERMNVQVKHILAELLQTIKSTFPMSIKIARTFPKQDLWMVCANATQLHQVFMNFCVNARDAMPNGGTLSISAENKIIDETYVRMNLDAKVGSYVAITFEDTGTGISQEHIDRVFDPFFTTKAIGEGTGLGLSTVVGIVKNHGGFVTVSSKVGQGTQFQVFFPAVEAAVSAPVETRKPFQGQGELILIADDEANIRETLKMTLEAQNYQVSLAADGIEAITAYAEHQDIKVVLLDMMLPSMSGAMVIQVFRRINQQVKIIACSGVPAPKSLLEMDEVKAFLPKPFTSDDLLNTLHRVINEE